MQFSVPVLQNNLGWVPTLSIFALFLLLLLMFLSNPNSVPETSQRSLEEIEQDMRRRQSMNKTDDNDDDIMVYLPTEETYLLEKAWFWIIKEYAIVKLVPTSQVGVLHCMWSLSIRAEIGKTEKNL